MKKAAKGIIISNEYLDTLKFFQPSNVVSNSKSYLKLPRVDPLDQSFAIPHFNK